MAAGNTYTPISSQTLSSNTNTITLNSFSGYTDLHIVISYFTNGDGDDLLQLNGSGGTAYEQMELTSYSSASSGGVATFKAYNFSGQSSFRCTGGLGQSASTIPAIIDLYIPLYANTSTYHYVFGSYGTGSQALASSTTYAHDLWQGQWKNTSAITSLTISRASNLYLIGTTISLYGIQEA